MVSIPWSNMVNLLYLSKTHSVNPLSPTKPCLYSSSIYLQQDSIFLPQKLQLKPLSTHIIFRPLKWSLTQCSCVESLTSSDVDTGVLRVGIEEKDNEALLFKNLALTSSSLDSVHVRVLSFRSIGLDDFVISLLINKKPNLVTSEEVDGFVSFVIRELNGSIAASQLERLFSYTDPSFLADFDQKVNLLVDRGVPRENITQILNSVNISKALCVKSVEELDRTIAFLSRFGGIELIIKRPTLLNYALDSHLIPRVGFFTKLSGGDEKAVGIILGKLPAVLNYTVKHFEDHVEFFRSYVGLTDEEIFKLVLVYPNVFSASKARKLLPRVEFLRECGLDCEETYKFLSKAPLFLSLSFEDNIIHKLVLLIKIGYQPRTKDLAAAMASVTRTSCQNMHKVIGLFMSYGFSSEDILVMSKRHPQILQYGHDSLEKKMEYLLEDMGREIGELLAFPAFLGYKLDDRIKARYESRKEISGEGMSINKLLAVSTERFSRRKRRKSKINVRAVEEIVEQG